MGFADVRAGTQKRRAARRYGNYWEYGWNGTRTDEALPACSTLAPRGAGAKWDEDWAFCTTNHFMRTQLHTAPFRAWTDAGGADAGSVLY